MDQFYRHPLVVNRKYASEKLAVAIAGLWVLAGSIHIAQGIWFSGWNNYLGDESDGRLNNLILEHGYQSLLGNYSLVSPGQFAPAEYTLAYSDMHLGTLPFYILGRLLGCTVEGSYQFWAICIGLLNGAAFLILFRSLKIPWLIAGPMCFMGASPATMVFYAGMHIQLLPIFAFVMSIRDLVRFYNENRITHFIYSIGYLSWLHLCSPYLGFYGTIAFLGIAVAVLIRLRLEGRSISLESLFPNVSGAVGMIAVGIFFSGVVWMYAFYAFQYKEMGGRNLDALIQSSPSWKLWTFAVGGHWLYGNPFPWSKTLDFADFSLFSGWCPWIGLILGVVVGARYRGIEHGFLAMCFAWVSVGMILFFTRWSEEGLSVFIWLASQVDALTAFRVSFRSVLIIHVLQAIAFCISLSVLYGKANTKLIRGSLAVLSLFAALESLSFKQRSTSKERVQDKRDAIIEAWMVEGDAPHLVFAPGPYNGQPSSAHLDAWSAALHLGRWTINGYSGFAPPAHSRFLNNPNVDRAYDLVSDLGLEETDYSMVDSWGNAELKHGIARYDSAPDVILEGFDLQPQWWELSFPIEKYEVEGVVYYQFTPKMSARFLLPGNASRLRMLLRLREGAYGPDSNSDGVEMKWFNLISGRKSLLSSIYFNPRDKLEHRGGYEFIVDLPKITEGELLLVVSGGPKSEIAWDWFLVGQLRVE